MQQENPRAGAQKLLFIADVEAIIGRRRITLRRWWLTNKFPKPIKLNDSSLVWHADTIEQWIAETINPTAV